MLCDQPLYSPSHGVITAVTILRICFSVESHQVVTLPLKKTHCLKVDRVLSWSLYVNHHNVDPSKCGALKSFPKTLNAESLSRLVTKVDGLSIICARQSDVHFVKMVAAKKGKIVAPDGKVAVYVDDYTSTKTVHTADCELICPSTKCESCKTYRANLRSIYNRWSKQRGFDGSDTSSHTNDRYLNTPEKKAKIDGLRKRVHIEEEEVKTERLGTDIARAR